MKMRRIISKGLVLSGMPAAQLRMLEQVALHADPSGSPAASERLYQTPVKQPQNDTDEELVDDWQEFVMPDLRQEFTRQLDCVANDLRQAQPESTPSPQHDDSLREDESEDEDEDESEDEDEDEDEDKDEDESEGEDAATSPAATYELIIPFDHIESWYGALNQARLVMQERYEFPETENLAAMIGLLTSKNLKPYLTSRFYMEIQGALLDLGMDVA
jgi:hypothetical protein